MRTFEKILFGLKYDVANDTKEEELGIESVCTFNKKSVSLTLFVHTLFRSLFFRKRKTPMKFNVIFCWSRQLTFQYIYYSSTIIRAILLIFQILYGWSWQLAFSIIRRYDWSVSLICHSFKFIQNRSKIFW